MWRTIAHGVLAVLLACSAVVLGSWPATVLGLAWLAVYVAESWAVLTLNKRLAKMQQELDDKFSRLSNRIQGKHL